jgi:hypothetical protein
MTRVMARLREVRGSRRGRTIGSLAALMLLIVGFFALQTYFEATPRDARSPRGPCRLNEVSYSHGALARRGESRVRCDNGAWVPATAADDPGLR